MRPEAANREYSTIGALLACLLAGLVTVSFGAPGPILPAILWSLSAHGCGFVIGFLFAVPRATELTAGSRLKINNNLVEVSDWLTKIIVGLGLIHLSRVPVYLQRAGYYVGTGLRRPDGEIPEQFAAALILYFALLGFLAGYLVTRLFLGPAFRDADAATAAEIKSLLAAEVEATPGERKPLAPSAKATAERLAALPLSEIPNEAEQLAAWGRAKFEEERYSEAVEALERAVRLNPGNPRFRYLLALALKYSKASESDVVGQLEEALRLVAGGAQPSMRERIYISYTFNALFLAPPDGFNRARRAAEEFLTNPGARIPPEILVNLACAYGQEYAFRKGDDSARAELRAKALAAVRKTLEIDGSWRPRLIQLLKGESRGDDDLVSFRDDKEFRALLGLQD